MPGEPTTKTAQVTFVQVSTAALRRGEKMQSNQWHFFIRLSLVEGH